MPRRNMRLCARNNITRGGALGMSYHLGQQIAPGYAEIVSVPSCGGVARPGMIGPIESAAITGRGLIGGARVKNTRSVKRHRNSWNSRTHKRVRNGGAGEATSLFTPITNAVCDMKGGGVAGYTFQPSDFLSSTGTPLAISAPMEARSCLKSGGSRRRRRISRRARRNSIRKYKK
jgi:hypothetical protein